MSDIDIYRALPEVERERLGFERWWDIQTRHTHSAECWKYGPSHYACALREIARLSGSERPPDQDGTTPACWRFSDETLADACTGWAAWLGARPLGAIAGGEACPIAGLLRECATKLGELESQLAA